MASEPSIHPGWSDLANMIGAEFYYHTLPDAETAETFWGATRDFFEGEGYGKYELLSLEVMAERSVHRYQKELRNMGVL